MIDEMRKRAGGLPSRPSKPIGDAAGAIKDIFGKIGGKKRPGGPWKKPPPWWGGIRPLPPKGPPKLPGPGPGWGKKPIKPPWSLIQPWPPGEMKKPYRPGPIIIGGPADSPLRYYPMGAKK